MWTYTNGTVAKNAFDCPETTTINGIECLTANGAPEVISAKFIMLGDSTVIVEHGKATVAGALINGQFVACSSLAVDNNARFDTIFADSKLTRLNGAPRYAFGKELDYDNVKVMINNGAVVIDSVRSVVPCDYLSQLSGSTELILSGIVSHDPHTGALFIDEPEHVTADLTNATYSTSVVLNTESTEYNDAGNWVGILFAVQAIGSVLWAVVLPMFRSRKFSYSLSLLLGAAGFITAGIFTDPYLLFVSFVLIGCAWAAMLAWPFTILTNSLKGGNIGAYLGLFNCSICIPQIIGALAGGWILSLIGSPDQLAPQATMMIIAGISLIAGAVCVVFIREKSVSKE
ncbi:MAG: MFS transporter [Muribaculaceae bacterium]|nr:MFS transporter [Muribaculaceae bacterium]